MKARVAALLVALVATGPLAAQAKPKPQPAGKPTPAGKPAAGRPAAGRPAAAAAKPAPAPPAPAAKPDSARAAVAAAPKPDSNAAPVLKREIFSYEGGGRDPFLSLLKSGDIRPLLSDLKLTGIYYDGRFAARSVAVLRDVTNNHIYRVKPGEIIGRLKVTAIRPREIVFTVQEFGFERQESLTLAKQEVTP